MGLRPPLSPFQLHIVSRESLCRRICELSFLLQNIEELHSSILHTLQLQRHTYLEYDMTHFHIYLFLVWVRPLKGLLIHPCPKKEASFDVENAQFPKNLQNLYWNEI